MPLSKTMPIRALLVLSLALIIFGSISLIPALPAANASSGRVNFVAHLSAAPGVTTRATGEAIFHLSADGSTLSYKLIVSNINNVFMAHIHYEDGSIILWLYPNPNLVSASGQSACIAVLSGGNPSACPGYVQGRSSGILAQGTLTAANLSPADCAGCNGFTFQDLISAMMSGNAFVNVHTTQNPGGEIQGTIQ
jgi:hypothetical protein